MEFVLLFVVLGVVLVFLKVSGLGLREVFTGPTATKRTSHYHYSRRKYLMTQSENNFFKLLVQAVGDQMNVFPQIRLSSLLYRAKGIERKYWRAALSRINQKSIDYVLCDKVTGEILLAIELDDSTHDTAIRKERDNDVNTMLKEAGMPLMRFRNIANLTEGALKSHINEYLPNVLKDSGAQSEEAYINSY